jgi:hypothetical protein
MKGNVRRPAHKFGLNLALTKFSQLAVELQGLRDSPPRIKAESGRRTGEILRFIRGLRLSAQVIYILREHLSDSDLEVSWGHLLDEDKAMCSPECDIIIHEKGHVARWNGGEHPIMDFRFIAASKARAVVSCKSSLTDVDQVYPHDLLSHGVNKVFLFAECCRSDRFTALSKKAKRAGYSALGCLYFNDEKNGGYKTDEKGHVTFVDAVRKAVGA